MRPVAAIDCGTNAIRLLIAHVDGDGTLVDHERHMQVVRLGEGVDATGAFTDVALARTFAALDEYAERIRAERCSRVRFVATSASRDVTNRAAFEQGVASRLGVPPEVISGDEEAALSFVGAVRGLPTGVVDGTALVADIGGGSTEFVRGDRAVTSSRSVDIGCVRMTERHLHSDPPTDAEVSAAREDIAAAVEVARDAVDFAGARLVGVAGTVTTVAAMALGLDRYDSAAIHGSTITAAQAVHVADTLLAMTRARRAALPFMHPGRVDVIGAGAMILATIVEAGGFADVVVSETDILDGIVYRLEGC